MIFIPIFAKFYGMFLKHNQNVIARAAKQFGLLRRASLLAMTMMIFFSLGGYAQEYIPPPLFEAPKETTPVEPAKEQNIPVFPKPSAKPTPILKKDVPPPPSVIKATPNPTTQPPAASEGMAKGPKTMPSAPAKSVEREVLYEPENKIIPMMSKLKENKVTAIESPEFVPPLPELKTTPEGALETTIYFVSNIKELSQTNQTTIKHLIIPELSKNSAKRLLIQAYASPQDNVLNGDRRTALSRALNVRRFLIEQEISPSRIDVRAVGAQTNVQPLDRVELILR